MNFAVLQFPGSNCDQDVVHVLRNVLGHSARLLWHKEPSLGETDAVIVPGGFSYGDYLRTGAIARFSPVMEAVQRFAANGGLVLGICNGFQVLVKMGGSLFPFGWLKFFTEKKKIDRCRTMALGVLPEYRKRGIDAVLYYEAMKEGIRIGQKWAEFSWMLEDNLDILKPLEIFGGRIYRRYRLVAKRL